MTDQSSPVRLRQPLLSVGGETQLKVQDTSSSPPTSRRHGREKAERGKGSKSSARDSPQYSSTHAHHDGTTVLPGEEVRTGRTNGEERKQRRRDRALHGGGGKRRKSAVGWRRQLRSRRDNWPGRNYFMVLPCATSCGGQVLVLGPEVSHVLFTVACCLVPSALLMLFVLPRGIGLTSLLSLPSFHAEICITESSFALALTLVLSALARVATTDPGILPRNDRLTMPDPRPDQFVRPKRRVRGPMLQWPPPPSPSQNKRHQRGEEEEEGGEGGGGGEERGDEEEERNDHDKEKGGVWSGGDKKEKEKKDDEKGNTMVDEGLCVPLPDGWNSPYGPAFNHLFPKPNERIDLTRHVKYCQTCNLFRPPGSKHCTYCDNCVADFDHHCPWTGTCVAGRNYGFFLSFISSVLVLSILAVIFCTAQLYWLGKRGGEDRPFDLSVAVHQGPVAMGVLIFSLLALWALCSLCAYHCCYLMCHAATTNEAIRHERRQRRERDRKDGREEEEEEEGEGERQPRRRNHRNGLIRVSRTHRGWCGNLSRHCCTTINALEDDDGVPRESLLTASFLAEEVEVVVAEEEIIDI